MTDTRRGPGRPPNGPDPVTLPAVRVPQALRDAFQQRADDRHTTLSDEIRAALERDLTA